MERGSTISLDMKEGLSQDQHQSQVVDGSWSGFSNGLGGNQRQIDPSLIANLVYILFPYDGVFHGLCSVYMFHL